MKKTINLFNAIIIGFLIFILLPQNTYADMAPPTFGVGTLTGVLPVLVVTLIYELLTAFVFLSLTKISKKILISVAAVNVISLPSLYLAGSALAAYLITVNQAILNGLLLAFEILIVLFEAYFIYRLNRKLISFKRSLTLSVVMNLASFFLPLLVLGLSRGGLSCLRNIDVGGSVPWLNKFCWRITTVLSGQWR